MNFKILTVNGQDLSGASHAVAAEAFKNAPEPITVVLRRTNNKKSSENPISPTAAKNAPGPTTASTQTPVNGSHVCFCRFLMENCRRYSSPAWSLIMRELMHYKNLNTNGDFNDVTNLESGGESFPTEDEDDVFGIDYEEVVLKRPINQDKLGIMLCDHRDAFSGRVKVLVSEVAPDSVAARCQKIREGDQIVKINGSPVNCMNEASRILLKDTSSISFIIGHPHLLNEETWAGDDHVTFNESLEGDDVLRDVTNYSHDENRITTSDESRSRLLGYRNRDECVDFGKMASQKMKCDKNGTTESGLSNISTSSGSQTEKDSGIGRTIDSTTQSTMDNITETTRTDSRSFCTDSSRGSSASHSLAREFTYVQPEDYRQCKKRASPAQRSSSAECSGDSIERTDTNARNTELYRLNEAIENLELEDALKPSAITRFESFEKEDDIVSPWVKIARQDYEDKIRQLQTSGDLRNLHPAMNQGDVGDMNIVMAAISASRSPSITTDNTSSAYSTGESFRSSSTASAPRLGNELMTPPLSPGQKQSQNEFILPSNAKSDWNPSSVTMTYYVSSDANSDGEGPACYLTHNEGSESEGFEDAGLEFSSSMFTSVHNESIKPVPLPRILHPPYEATGFMSHSLTASTKELCKAAAAVAQTRRHSMNPELHKVHVKANPTELFGRRSVNRKSPSRRRSNSIGTIGDSSSKDRSESETVIAANSRTSFPREGSPVAAYNSHARRASTGSRKTQAKLAGRRTQNNYESTVQDKEENTSGTGDGSSNGDVQMEWKVRVSKDGTRYITKRPVREKVLRNREKRLLAERCMTTDDDITELKLGRHWSRDERKRHLRHAREKRRRRDFMQRCRLEVLNENTPADGEIVELSHKKMSKQKHKRMLLDSFVTVQEILAHGDRSSGVTKLNPLLSVTYI
ncbi:E3 ubiquitin-protein ligase PDZRN3-like isoform X3 [Clavelina lepadiformis]|uniref:E3 ubiquitin-protein ligase PDZRN3-like isoform X3 n=1 Tax=Clavelina lepadiformis TaxID=159417 RepID=UPI004041CF0B